MRGANWRTVGKQVNFANRGTHKVHTRGRVRRGARSDRGKGRSSDGWEEIKFAFQIPFTVCACSVGAHFSTNSRWVAARQQQHRRLAAGKRIREKSEPPPYDVVRNSTLLALPNERQRGRSRFDSFFCQLKYCEERHAATYWARNKCLQNVISTTQASLV